MNISNRSLELILPLTNQPAIDEKTFLDSVEISISHELGGINYFTYKESPRGWFMHFQPVHIENKGEYNTKQTILFHKRAYKMFIAEGGRFNAKKLKELFEILVENKEEILKLYNNEKDKELYNFLHKIYGVN